MRSSVSTHAPPQPRRDRYAARPPGGTACFVGERGQVTLDVSPDLLSRQVEKECALISRRTKEALAAAKARRVQLGNPELAAANRAAARERAEALRPVLMELRDLSANAAAIELNRRGVPTPAGGKWRAKTVLRVRRRLAHSH